MEARVFPLRRQRDKKKIPMVGVVFHERDTAHRVIAHGFNRETMNGFCQFRFFPVGERSMAALQGVLSPAVFKEIDCIVVVGTTLTVLIKKFCKKYGPRDILSLGAGWLKEAGILDNLDLPGGHLSAICMDLEAINTLPKYVSLFVKRRKKVLVVHSTPKYLGWFSEKAAAVKGIVEQAGAQVHIEVLAPGLRTESRLRKLCQAYDIIVLFEGCILNMYVRALIHESWCREKLFIGGQGMISIDQGAPVAFGPEFLDLSEVGMTRLREWAANKRPMGAYPAVMLPSKRVFYVNIPMLRHLGNEEELIEELKKRDDVVVIKHWPRSF